MTSNIKNTRELSIYVTTKKYVEGIENILKTLEKDELFNNGMNYNDYASLTLDELRDLCTQRARRTISYDFPREANIGTAHSLIHHGDLKRGINAGVCLQVFQHLNFLILTCRDLLLTF